jgi:hypothetical protein
MPYVSSKVVVASPLPVTLISGNLQSLVSCLQFGLQEVYVDGRAIAQVVSRRLPTAQDRVRAQMRSYGI